MKASTDVGNNLMLMDSRDHLVSCCVPVMSVVEAGDVLCSVLPGLFIHLTHV